LVYHIESHTMPRQLERLIGRLTEAGSGREPVIVVNHDSRSTDDLSAVAALPGVHVTRSPGGYADFSHVRRYLETLDWLARENIDYDWIANISGQDYPLRDVAEAEATLDVPGIDGYLQWFDAFDARSPWGARLGRSRYNYRHRRIAGLDPRWRGPLHGAQGVNYIQPWVRVTVSTGLTVGVRQARTPFEPDFRCYGGSLFCTVTREVAEYLREFAVERRDITEYYQRTLSPAESFIQTVLINSHRFTFEPDCRRYFDFRNSRFNHPKTLTAADLPRALASGADFGRKFDVRVDPRPFDQLDRLVHQETR
jgi:Core-2/I-Branching enzyme